MAKQLECIYCPKPNEESEAHIFPEALGNGPSFPRGVCKKCNNALSKIEQPVIKGLAPVRNFLQLIGKRGKRTAMEIEVDLVDKKQKLRVRHPRDLDSRLFAFRKIIEGGKAKIGFIGPKEKIEEAKRAYQAKHPKTVWEEITPAEMEQLAFTMDFDLAIFASAACLRMVAKIALEWWVWKRGASAVMNSDFDDIRDFILHGKEAAYPIVSILQDPRILKYFGFIPFGIHAVFCGIDPRSRNLVILIGIFSLVYFKVILTRKHPSFAKVETLGTVNPQTGKYYEPVIRVSMASGPFISRIERADLAKPIEVIRAMKAAIIKRLNDGMEQIRSQSI